MTCKWLIGAAALALACGGSDQSDNREGAAAESDGAAGSQDTAGTTGAAPATATRNRQTSVGGHGTMGSAARGDVRNQRLVVESIEIITQSCGQEQTPELLRYAASSVVNAARRNRSWAAWLTPKAN